MLGLYIAALEDALMLVLVLVLKLALGFYGEHHARLSHILKPNSFLFLY